MNDFFSALGQAVRRNRFAMLCALAGLVLAILFLTIGFFRALLITAFVAAGAVGGTFIDRRRSGGKAQRQAAFGGYDSSSFQPFDDDR